MKSIKDQLYSFRLPNAQRVFTVMDPNSITQSEFAPELDINRLVEKHIKGGIPFPSAAQNNYADVSDLADFQSSMEIVTKAQETWMDVDARIRRHFGDRVENFLNALHDKSRKDELINLGIYKKPEPLPAAPVNGGPGGVATGSKGEAPGNPGGAKPGTVST